MRLSAIGVVVVAALLSPAFSPAQNPTHFTLTITVEGMSSDEGNLGVLVFNGPKGWAEDRQAAFKDIAVTAVKGTQILKVTDLPPGK